MGMKCDVTRIRSIIMHDKGSFTCTYVSMTNSNEYYSLHYQSINLTNQVGDYVIILIRSNEVTKLVIGRISPSKSTCNGKCMFKYVICRNIFCGNITMHSDQVIENLSLFTALYVWRNVVSKSNYILFIPEPKALR